MFQPWLGALSSSPLFRGIGPEALNIMLSCLKPRVQRCKQREIVAVYGQPFNGIGIIATGSVTLTRETYSGNRIMLGILEPGEIFGETAAFSDNKFWPMTVIAQEDSALLFLPPDKIVGSCSNVCRSHSSLIMNTLNILSNRVLLMNKKIELLSAKSVRAKVSGYLLDLYRQAGETAVVIPMKRHELADYLNIPRPSLSREMGLMRDEGIIEFKGAGVSLKKIPQLEKAVE